MCFCWSQGPRRPVKSRQRRSKGLHHQIIHTVDGLTLEKRCVSAMVGGHSRSAKKKKLRGTEELKRRVGSKQQDFGALM